MHKPSSMLDHLSDNYLVETLSPRQMKRLERKTKKACSQQRKTTDLNVVPITAETKPVEKVRAKNKKQQLLLDYLDNFEQVIVQGPAGTGKTFITVSRACELFIDRKIGKIVIARPNVGVGKSMGFLPGSLEEKYGAWLAETIQIMKMKLGQSLFELALKRGDIEMVPFEMIRGRSFSNAFILVTEAQNLSIDEAQSLVTRVGEDSTLVIDGDIRQTDIKTNNGLTWILETIDKNDSLKKYSGIVEFGIDDVVRSGLCAAWVKAIWKQ